MSVREAVNRKRLCILGSTGSIGTQSLDIVTAFPEQFEILGLTAGSNLKLLKEQIVRYKPQWAMINTPSLQEDLRTWAQELPFKVHILDSTTNLTEKLIQPELDLVIMAIVGTAALIPTATALKAGKIVGLASKEVLVAAGNIIMRLANSHGGKLIPIDSEHAALQQCMAAVAGNTSPLTRVILTASGGPFRTRDANTFQDITPAEALKHPRWQMGPKISIDSATLMNKGLEVIEAHHLFGIPYENIEVLVHPQSIVHAMTEFIDGNILAHLGPADMRFPIQYMMTYPDKWEAPWPRLDLAQMGRLHFESPDFNKFPMLKLAYDCGKAGESTPLIMNASNEVLVAQFLSGRIGFLDIISGIKRTLDHFSDKRNDSLEEAVALDIEVKNYVSQ
jgi:1-deoxy-D-xylulose-5-phosphate reductoisomerase